MYSNLNLSSHSHTFLSLPQYIKTVYGEFDGRRDKRVLIKIIGE